MAIQEDIKSEFTATDVGEGWHCSLDIDIYSAFATFVPKHLADNEHMAIKVAENRFNKIIRNHKGFHLI